VTVEIRAQVKAVIRVKVAMVGVRVMDMLRALGRVRIGGRAMVAVGTGVMLRVIRATVRGMGRTRVDTGIMARVVTKIRIRRESQKIGAEVMVRTRARGQLTFCCTGREWGPGGGLHDVLWCSLVPCNEICCGCTQRHAAVRQHRS